MIKLSYLILISFFLISCGASSPKKSSAIKQDANQIYASKNFLVKVFYEPGAEPYAGGNGQMRYWDILQKNIETLFDGRSVEPVVTVPKELSAMSALPVFSKSKWSAQDILDLSKTVATPVASRDTVFSIFFVNGRSSDGDNILGFHISGTTVIAIFKEVVRGTSSGLDAVPKYVEQATLVHEMGHALGLVNNGKAMVSAHQDSAHGAHCSNQNCVMYYSNEGRDGLARFVTKFITSQDVILFDQSCLDDSRSEK